MDLLNILQIGAFLFGVLAYFMVQDLHNKSKKRSEEWNNKMDYLHFKTFKKQKEVKIKEVKVLDEFEQFDIELQTWKDSKKQ